MILFWSESKNFPEGGSQLKNGRQNMDAYIDSVTTQAIVVENLVGTHTTDPKGAKLDTINRIFSRTLMTFLIVTKQDHVLFHSRDKTQHNNRHHRHFRNRPFRCCFK